METSTLSHRELPSTVTVTLNSLELSSNYCSLFATTASRLQHNSRRRLLLLVFLGLTTVTVQGTWYLLHMCKAITGAYTPAAVYVEVSFLRNREVRIPASYILIQRIICFATIPLRKAYKPYLQFSALYPIQPQDLIHEAVTPKIFCAMPLLTR